MKKYIVLVAAVVLAACGTGSSPQKDLGGTDQGGPQIGNVPGTALLGTSLEMKVVLRVTTAFYTQVVTNPSGDDVTFVPVACPATTCGTGEVCHQGFCSVEEFKNVDFYVKNIAVPVPANPPSFPVPCDGRLYSAVLFGGFPEPATGRYQIQEVHATTPFTMGTDCSASGLAWDTATSAIALPAPIFPQIYAGLGAPYDTFTVRVSGLKNPWSSVSSLTYPDGTNAISPTAAGVFPSPSTAAPLRFTGQYYVHPSLLATGEAPTSWYLTMFYDVTPWASTGVAPPPTPTP
jgi:hypothetical protein